MRSVLYRPPSQSKSAPAPTACSLMDGTFGLLAGRLRLSRAERVDTVSAKRAEGYPMAPPLFRAHGVIP